MQLLVIRLPDLLQIVGPFLVRRCLARLKTRTAVKQHVRVQAGGGGGIQRFIVRRAVQVNDKARVIADQHAGTHRTGKII
ncbi:hypothetical protein D3C75_1213130 [compost metagenome]